MAVWKDDTTADVIFVIGKATKAIKPETDTCWAKLCPRLCITAQDL